MRLRMVLRPRNTLLGRLALGHLQIATLHEIKDRNAGHLVFTTRRHAIWNGSGDLGTAAGGRL